MHELWQLGHWLVTSRSLGPVHWKSEFSVFWAVITSTPSAAAPKRNRNDMTKHGVGEEEYSQLRGAYGVAAVWICQVTYLHTRAGGFYRYCWGNVEHESQGYLQPSQRFSSHGQWYVGA